MAEQAEIARFEKKEKSRTVYSKGMNGRNKELDPRIRKSCRSLASAIGDQISFLKSLPC